MTKTSKISWTKILTKIITNPLIHYLKIKNISHNNNLFNNLLIKTLKILIWKTPYHFSVVSPKHVKSLIVPTQNWWTRLQGIKIVTKKINKVHKFSRLRIVSKKEFKELSLKINSYSNNYSFFDFLSLQNILRNNAWMKFEKNDLVFNYYDLTYSFDLINLNEYSNN